MATAAATRIQLCGPLVVRIDGRRVDDAFAAAQARLLLGYLVLHRDVPKARDELAWAVWGEQPPAAVGTALSALLSKLRTAIGPEHVTGRTLLRLALPADAFVDVEAAAHAVHQADAALLRGEPEGAAGPCEVAMSIAERPFLMGVDAPWVAEERHRLEQLLIRALGLAVRYGLGMGGVELTRAERCARRLVELAPYHERGHALLMDVLVELGNPAEALLVYQRARELLRDELGTDPGIELRARHAQLLQAGDDQVRPPGPSRAGRRG